MRFSFPRSPYWLKTVVIAAVLALFGLLLFPLIGGLEPRLLFVLALFAGALIGAIAAATTVKQAPSKPGKGQTLFVGNLPYKASEEELRNLFGKYGPVTGVRIMKDRKTRRPRGYGFVEMDAGADKAIKALDGRDFLGRELKVKEGSQRGNGEAAESN